MAFWSVWKENRALKERMEKLFAKCDELSAENAVPLGIPDSLNVDRVAGLGAKRHQAGAAALPAVWKE